MNPKRPSEDDIARKAYELWEAEGRPEGRDIAHWHQAERNITDPVVVPIPEAPPIPQASPVPETPPVPPAAGEAAAAAAKPRATRARKPKPAGDAAEAAAKPKAPRRRKAAEPEA